MNKNNRQWQDPEDLPLAVLYDYDPRTKMITAIPITLNAVNSEGKFVTVTYRVNGDYEDRWVDDAGQFHEIVKWRLALSNA